MSRAGVAIKVGADGWRGRDWLSRGKLELLALASPWLPRAVRGRLAVTLHNVNRIRPIAGQPRALVAYLPQAFLLNDHEPAAIAHQNLRRCRYIAGLLGERGYLVDVTSGRSPAVSRPAQYDLILSDRASLGLLQRSFRPDALKIYLATTQNHKRHNEQIRRRHEQLGERREIAVRERRIYSENLAFARQADAIISIGSARAAATWMPVARGPVLAFNNFAFRETPVFLEKDFDVARRHFLFFASSSQVMKGLDLLLEIFPRHPELHLYVCSLFDREEDFVACYRRELYSTPNVHPVGWVSALGREFHRLAQRCAYTILPTCSEGQPGSVVQCMASGLIPLLTADANIETEDFGLTCASDAIEEIERTILSVSRRAPEWHRERAVRTHQRAAEAYSETAFVTRWREMLELVLPKGSAARSVRPRSEQ